MEYNKKHLSLAGENGRVMMADLHLPKDEEIKSLVIYAHGINGFKDWGGMNLIAHRFALRGHAFLKFNYSHNGTTPESPEAFADTEAYGNDNYGIRQRDLKSIIDFTRTLEEISHVDDLTLVGHSRGGTDVILYASQDERVTRIITWAAAAEAKTPWRKWDVEELAEWRENGVKFLHNSRTGQNLPVYYQLYEEFQSDHKQLNVEEAARKLDKPWLIIHGADDESVFIKDAYSLKEWQPRAEVVVIPDTGHTFGRSHPWQESELPESTQRLVEESIRFIESKS